MPRHLILGTAGHIDHGKTSLVKALTGVDCDRLPEEKARGITIDLGYAQLVLPNVTYGIVDVPGHERFIRNMLAGAMGFDVVMLVVAADDSVMPQTREHFELLKCLPVRTGVVVITKSDIVDDEQMELVKLDISQMVQNSFLEKAPIIPTSVRTGQGIGTLKGWLNDVSGHLNDRETSRHVRMPIDRSFSVPGHGTVVTGTVLSGRIAVGDELEWHRGSARTERVRVRGLAQHGTPVNEAGPGQRLAINIPGVDCEAIRRGHELATPDFLHASQILTVSLNTFQSLKSSLKHRQSCRLHIGTNEIIARLSLLDSDRLEHGQSGLAQLFCEEPVTTAWGQALILRDVGGERSLGGGSVLQPQATRLRRRHIESIIRLGDLSSQDPATRIAAAVWFSGMAGLEECEFERVAGTDLTQSLESKPLVRLHDETRRWFHAERIQAFETRVLECVRQLHVEFPLQSALDRGRVVSQFENETAPDVVHAVIERLLNEKKLRSEKKKIAHSEFKPKLSIAQRKLKDKIVDEIRKAGLNPPSMETYLSHVNGQARSLEEIFDVAIAEGELVGIGHSIYFSAEMECDIRQKVIEGFRLHSAMTVAEIRDLLGTTRKFAIPICEYLDKIGMTIRDGDIRRLSDPKAPS